MKTSRMILKQKTIEIDVMLKFSLKVRQVKQTIQNWIIYRSSIIDLFTHRNRK